MSDEDQEKERLNRKLIELLNELRIALPGVQVLFAFLLILPFNSGFAETDDLDRAVYAVSLGCAAVASALLIGPAAYHRHRFRRLEEETASEKKEMIITQDHLAAGGILFLALAMAGLGLSWCSASCSGRPSRRSLPEVSSSPTRGSGTRSLCRGRSVTPVRAAERKDEVINPMHG
jgi:hypothetical protein